MVAIFQMTFSKGFYSMEIYKYWLGFHWILIPKVKNTRALVQIMAWRRPGDKPLAELMMVSILPHICVLWRHWVIRHILFAKAHLCTFGEARCYICGPHCLIIPVQFINVCGSLSWQLLLECVKIIISCVYGWGFGTGMLTEFDLNRERTIKFLLPNTVT